MFEHDHYVPVLRWKGAERTAVQNLPNSIRDGLTPLIELVPKHIAKTRIEIAARQVAESWGWNRLTFVDFNLLPEEAMPLAIPRFAACAIRYNIGLAVATGLARGTNYQTGVRAAIEASHCGLCLRIYPHDFRSGRVVAQIEELLGFFGVAASSVHLILDFQSICGHPPDMTDWVSRIPKPTEWRTFTLLAGSFPKDLSDFDKNSQQILQRSDLLCWEDYLALAKGRMASFGDYTVQHGVFEEHEGKQLNFSASLRYASRSDWVIMRGEGVFNEDGPGFAQWPANAALLCERDEFSGGTFSWGDDYIKKMSLGFKTGGAKDWLAATINHHITLTVHQIAEISAAANRSASFHG
jgi:hypothetical protein